MKRLLTEMDDDSMRKRVEGLELYFIPTLNPDGLKVVTTGRDQTYRKNGRDNIGDGALRVISGLGQDTSGVDLNRNFGLHWERGDSLYYNTGADDAYNYYRGPGPFSEPETRAVRDLMLSRRFLFAISYHCSRSGRNAELVIGPWSWGGRLPPDDAVIQELGNALATRLPCEDGQGTYRPVHATQQVGQEQDWAYQATGALLYMIELGQTVQPDSALLARIISEASPSAFYLMDIAAGQRALPGYGLASVMVTDGVTGLPLVADVIPDGVRLPVLEPRFTNSETGRWEQLFRGGTYSLLVRAHGYYDQWLDSVTVQNGIESAYFTVLQPKPQYESRLTLTDQASDSVLTGRLLIQSPDYRPPLDLEVSSEHSVLLSEGSYRFSATSNGYVPATGTLNVSSDSAATIRLFTGKEQFSNDFDNYGNWQSGGVGAYWGIQESNGRNCLTESPSREYIANSNAWILIETGVVPEANHPMTLQLIHRPNFEPGEDGCAIDVHLPYSNEFRRVAQFSSFPPESWDTVYISLDGLRLDGYQVRLRLWVMADEVAQEDGWLIDRLSLFYSDQVTSAPIIAPLPTQVSLAAYPNPSNGLLSIYLTLPTQREGLLALHDQNGRVVSVIRRGLFPSGSQHLVFDASSLSSGTYYLSLKSPGAVSPLAPAIPVVILK